jgi:hypothetical protein
MTELKKENNACPECGCADVHSMDCPLNNSLGFSSCFSCGKEYSEADDWALFRDVNNPDTNGVNICPDCLAKTNMVWKYKEEYQRLIGLVDNIIRLVMPN